MGAGRTQWFHSEIILQLNIIWCLQKRNSEFTTNYNPYLRNWHYQNPVRFNMIIKQLIVVYKLIIIIISREDCYPNYHLQKYLNCLSSIGIKTESGKYCVSSRINISPSLIINDWFSYILYQYINFDNLNFFGSGLEKSFLTVLPPTTGFY